MTALPHCTICGSTNFSDGLHFINFYQPLYCSTDTEAEVRAKQAEAQRLHPPTMQCFASPLFRK